MFFADLVVVLMATVVGNLDMNNLHHLKKQRLGNIAMDIAFNKGMINKTADDAERMQNHIDRLELKICEIYGKYDSVATISDFDQKKIKQLKQFIHDSELMRDQFISWNNSFSESQRVIVK